MLSFILASIVFVASPVWSQLQPLKAGDPLPANLFVELAKIVNPAVVNISTTTMPKGRMYRDPFFEMMERFYGLPPQSPRMAPARSLGTGFIIREDGLIVTNNHVVEGADVINVQLTENSDKLYEAKIIGRDQRTDIALIKITTGNKLPTVKLGESKSTEVGEWVAAFGNPYGHGHTLTKGVISAKGREIAELNQLPFLQTDASINPGNSGGPLVNTQGLVIGVNTAIDARAQGIGFAIPIDEVKNLLPQLESTGKVKRGYIGVIMTDLNPEMAEGLGLKENEGIIVTQIEKNGPADKGGLEPYDIITEVNGKKIKNNYDMQSAIGNVPVGQMAKVKVLREGKTKTLDVKVGERPEDKKLAEHETKKAPTGQAAPHKLGFVVANLSAAMAQEWEIPEELVGRPIIIDVIHGSAAHRVGLRPGDVVLDVNRRPVSTAQDVVSNLKSGMNTLRLGRGDRAFIVMISSKK